MQLLTKEVVAKLPPLYSNEHKGLSRSLAVVKFFAPWSHWTWYASEGSYIDANGLQDTNEPRVDFICFGLVDGDYPEFGNFSLSELQSVRGPFGLTIERDLYYKPKTLQALFDECKNRQRF